jgi:Domain of unknown function (DUF4160)
MDIYRSMQSLDEIKDAVERSLAPDIVEMLRRIGLCLTLGSSDATAAASSIVAVNRGLAEQLQLEEELTADMVPYRKDVTGLDNTVFISVKFPRHAPRIKVAIDPPDSLNPAGDNAAVAIHDGSVKEGWLPARTLKAVHQFIELNRDVLLDYWDMRIDGNQLKERLKPIR